MQDTLPLPHIIYHVHYCCNDLVAIMLVVRVNPNVCVQSNAVHKYSPQMSLHEPRLYVLHSLPHLWNHGRVLIHAIDYKTHIEIMRYYS